ncbi:unnamed protein product [Mytilus coruscus]|uniref:Tyr recombinase domain-containing protein n=1 Tax=Mytilus coruscus TaxID=42192 RepID=A0A6J8DYM3_MYTCO|nr:unnamed protein product [Mytilus coruscus]
MSSITSDALFVSDDDNPLSIQFFIKHVKIILDNLGLQSKNYNGHSFRIGAATTAQEVRLEDHLIKTLGRWSLDCYIRLENTEQELNGIQQDLLFAQSQIAKNQGVRNPECQNCKSMDADWIDFKADVDNVTNFSDNPFVSKMCAVTRSQNSKLIDSNWLGGESPEQKLKVKEEENNSVERKFRRGEEESIKQLQEKDDIRRKLQRKLTHKDSEVKLLRRS